MRTPLMVGAAVLATALLVGSIAASRYYQSTYQWRVLTPTVRQFLVAARNQDTAVLGQLSTGTEPSARILGLAQVDPAQFDTLLSSLTLSSGAERGQDTVVLTYRTRATYCANTDGHPDAFQVRFVGPSNQRRIDYAAIVPC